MTIVSCGAVVRLALSQADEAERLSQDDIAGRTAGIECRRDIEPGET